MPKGRKWRQWEAEAEKLPPHERTMFWLNISLQASRRANFWLLVAYVGTFISVGLFFIGR